MRICAFVLVLLAALGARAEEEMKAAARKHKNAGTEYMAQEKYDRAVREFEAGVAIDPKPSLYWELAQAYVLAQKPAKAAQNFRKFLELSPDAPNREEIEDEIKALDGRAEAAPAPVKEKAKSRVVLPKAAPAQEEATSEAPPVPTVASGPTPQMFAQPGAQPPPSADAEDSSVVLRGVQGKRGDKPIDTKAERKRAPVAALEAPTIHEEQKSTHWAVWVGVGAAAVAAVAVGVVLATRKAAPEPVYTVDAR